MKKSTQELLDLLKKSSSFDSYLQDNKAQLGTGQLSVLLEQILEEKHLNKSDCIQKSGLDRIYAYQIFSGLKLPSRDKILALCRGMELNFEEVQQLLKQAGYPVLYPKNQRDCAFIYAFLHELSVMELNFMLHDIGEPLCT